MRQTQSIYHGVLYGAGLHVFALWHWIIAHQEAGAITINERRVADTLGAEFDGEIRSAIEFLCRDDVGMLKHLGGLEYEFPGFFDDLKKTREPKSSGIRLEVQKATPKKPEISKDAVAAAQYLYDSIKSHSPEYKSKAKPETISKHLLGWAKDLDYAMRLDGLSPDDVNAVIYFAHRDPRGEFWRGNILSGAKVRKHAERLLMERRKPSKKGARQMQAPTDEQVAAACQLFGTKFDDQ